MVAVFWSMALVYPTNLVIGVWDMVAAQLAAQLANNQLVPTKNQLSSY